MGALFFESRQSGRRPAERVSGTRKQDTLAGDNRFHRVRTRTQNLSVTKKIRTFVYPISAQAISNEGCALFLQCGFAAMSFYHITEENQRELYV